ncbi:MAG: leucyl aminopeptidase family protein [Gammaproteobacteria bacterium]|nr:leucyl aminopeptidase family protein [Gammaproteobacteria bacterium]
MPQVKQILSWPNAESLAGVEHLAVAAPEQPAAEIWKQVPGGGALRALYSKRKSKGVLTTRLDNAAHTGVSFDRVPATGSGDTLPAAFDVLSFAGRLIKSALQDDPASVALLVVGFSDADRDALLQALVLAVHAHAFRLPAYRKEADKAPRLKSIRVTGIRQRMDFSRTESEAAATNLARWLTAQPPNKLTMKSYQRCLRELAKQHGWETTLFDTRKLAKLGAGAFLAVAQGNREDGACIMQLRYRPPGMSRTAKPALSLVGKGIIFDTGGTNLKPFKSMLDMHHDMAGSAVAVATLLALTTQQVDFAVDCWVAITENRISGDAYKSRDIVTACNGTTIEVIHTDAEGRMALADTLALAGRTAPRAIIDFATLTGSCVVALTERYSGAFCNRDELHGAIVAAGRASGERVWSFPMDEDFDTELKSTVADVLQCAPGGGGDHIQAARFLSRFVPAESAWVHVDLSAATRKGGLAQVPGEVTGFGVRFALNLVLDQQPAALALQGARQA